MKQVSIRHAILLCIVFFTISCSITKEGNVNVTYKAYTLCLQNEEPKSITIIYKENLTIKDFENTFSNKFPTKKDFFNYYITSYEDHAKKEKMFSKIKIEVPPIKVNKPNESLYYNETNPWSLQNILKRGETDYVIGITNIVVSSKIKFNKYNPNSPGDEYLVVNTYFEIYDQRTKTMILKFISTGEIGASIFNYNQALKKAIDNSILYSIGYIKAGHSSFHINS